MHLEKGLAKFLEEEKIVAPSSEQGKMKDKNLKLTKVFKAKMPQEGGNANQTKQKVENKKSPNNKNYNSYALKKVTPK